MLKYTICFIKKDNEILLLNRNKKPNMGLWNGVGGKIEINESAYDGVIRETFEETGMTLEEVVFAGNVVWKSDNGESGMHVFLADFPKGSKISTPIKVEEGLLDWKKIDWIVDPDNRGVVSNISLFLPKMLKGELGFEHKFEYENNQIVAYSTSLIASESKLT
jgi:8-oxo-dGTP diphosphatase